jgi:hypothetical protein
MPLSVREATAEELVGWDARTVHVPGGDVYQSREWGEYRGRHGWRPRFLVVDDAYPVLALERPWRWIGGSGAYLSRGPIWSGGPVETVVDRLDAAASWLGRHGVDVIASDPEIPVTTGYPGLVRARGFHPIEEIQPSRHRLRRAIPSGSDEASILASFPATVRYELRGAERRGVRVIRYDRGPVEPSDAAAADPDLVTAVGPGFEAPAGGRLDRATLDAALGRLYGILEVTAERRQFKLGPADAFLDWAGHAIQAGQALVLEVWSPTDDLLGSAMFYRHGQRLTYANAGDVVAMRRAYPGVTHLILWRAVQLCLRENREELDLAGVDVPGLRRKPREGEPMYGLLRFKELLGGEWLELSGNQERVIRPWRYAAGRLTGRLASLTGEARLGRALPARAR